MEWYKTLVEIVLGLGGLAGIGAFLKIFLFAKQEKAGKAIENEGKEVENQHNIVQDYQHLLDWMQREMKEYKHEVDTRVADVKKEVVGLRTEIGHLKEIISDAYRCQYPPSIEDCPVVKAMRHSKECKDCAHKHTTQDCKE